MMFLWALSSTLLFVVSLGFWYWYVRNTSRYFEYMREAYEGIVREIAEFHMHVEEISKMEKFENEPVIDGLQQHAAAVAAFLSTTRKSIYFEEQEEDEQPTEERTE